MCEMDNYTVSGEQRLLNNRVIFHLAACSKTVECQTKTYSTDTDRSVQQVYSSESRMFVFDHCVLASATG